MPNTPVWGQNEGDPEVMGGQDLISAEESGSVIKVNDVNEDNDDKKAAHFINSSSDADARALMVEGLAEVEANNPGGAATSIGLLARNENVNEGSRALKVEGKTEISDYLYLGTDEDDGTVDANDSGRDLKVGTFFNKTNNVEIGRTGKEVNVKGRIDAEEHIRVGTAANDGLIDAADDARDLKIGTQVDYTGDLILSRSGKMTDIMGKTRFNKSQVIINDAASLGAASGCGFMYNSNGHPGPNEPCIDFYVAGTLVGYIDANGWNNA